MTTWRVLTWNVHGAALPDLVLLADVIRRATPDAVSLQEVRRHQASTLAAQLGWRYEWVFKHNPWTFLLWWQAEGLAILAPAAPVDVGRTVLSRGVSRWSYRRRVAISATVQRDADVLRLHDTHLATTSGDERIAQARRLAGVVALGTDPAVVAGDLNASDEVEVIREFAAVGLVDPGGEATSPAVAPHQRIDYVLVPAAAHITARNTPDGGQHWQRLSDHLPVLVEFEV
jgi:endonuclease/exonuclease/phosphatase family metal-dependent hydrolase